MYLPNTVIPPNYLLKLYLDFFRVHTYDILRENIYIEILNNSSVFYKSVVQL